MVSATAPLRTTCLALLALAVVAADAGAIPAFARRYQQTCSLCHGVIPRLNAVGEMVAGHGFRMAPGEELPDSVSGGDDLLALPRSVPLAFRVDGMVRLDADDNETAAGFDSPWVLKVLSSAPLGKSLSYYFYFLLNERGEVAGAEDAFLYWNDVAGRQVDLAVGQFQVSDPLFKRELRLPVDDYQIYRAKVGGQPATLAYDRGLMLLAEPAGTTLTLAVLNGNGLPAAEGGRYDDDPEKNFFAHATRDLADAVRLGVLGYHGRQRDDLGAANRLWMAGADVTLARSPLELNVQYVHREDDHPTFAAGETISVTDGGFAELLVLPEGSRWYGYGLYNRVEDNRGLLDFGYAAPGPVRLYESVAAGAGYLVQRNARVHGEVQYDTQLERARVTLGFTAAY
jgi:hypothetical protein